MLETIIASLLLNSVGFDAVAAPADEPHPSSYVDKGACPFECCTYRTWSVTKQTRLYVEPDTHSRKLSLLKAGESVQAITGEVHSTPVRFTVTQDHDSYKVGDVLWVYTYSGEGAFGVWRNGALEGEDLEFSPYGGTNGKRCEVSGHGCWGILERELNIVWWVKVKTKADTQGWSNQPEHFGNKDACG